MLPDDSAMEWRDYVYIGNRAMTPDALRRRFDAIRDDVFDQPIRQVPVKRESQYALHPNRLSDSERYRMDTACYDLDTPTSDDRVRNQFQYFTYMLSGIGHNISKLAAKRRTVIGLRNEVESLYRRRYAQSLSELGRKGMGSNADERDAWMRTQYPALCDIRDMCDGMSQEIDCEYERLDEMQQIVSRCITGMEQDVRMRGEYAWGNAQDKLTD
jgi:hypothetical protein